MVPRSVRRAVLAAALLPVLLAASPGSADTGTAPYDIGRRCVVVTGGGLFVPHCVADQAARVTGRLSTSQAEMSAGEDVGAFASATGYLASVGRTVAVPAGASGLTATASFADVVVPAGHSSLCVTVDDDAGAHVGGTCLDRAEATTLTINVPVAPGRTYEVTGALYTHFRDRTVGAGYVSPGVATATVTAVSVTFTT